MSTALDPSTDELLEAGNETARPEPPQPFPRGVVRQVRLKERAALAIASLLNDLLGPLEKRAFGILMYHRVVEPPPGWPRPTWNVPPQRFEQQLNGLLKRGWQPWPLSQVLDYIERRLDIPRKTFVVTFDDGYANVLTQARPILQALAVPATLFLATSYLDSDQPFPFDDWLASGKPGVPRETWRPLTTAECRQLTASGLIELGAHTHTHADFRGRSGALTEDLRQNLAVLRDRFRVERPAFAFPYGTKSDGFASAELAAAAQRVGTSCSMTTQGTVVRPADSRWDWGRFAAEEHDTARTLAARLGGWQERLRRLKRF
jgi:peptidoglycan/xylan/chitin deacetylase (PgdA/CDA1 family)